MRILYRNHRQVVVFIVLVAHLVYANGVHAWGKEGHEIVGNIAYQRLSPNVQSIVTNIVQLQRDDDDDNEYESPLAKIANWADKVRIYYNYRWSSKLHFVDIRDDLVEGGCHPRSHNEECVFSYQRDCPDDACAVGAVVNYTTQLANYYQQHQHNQHAHEKQLHAVRGTARNDATADDAPLLTSLKFLTHFMGDLHQPLHVSRTSDRGGNNIGVKLVRPSKKHPPPANSIPVYSPPLVDRYGHVITQHHYSHNLHSVWDKTIIEHATHKFFNGSQTAFQNSIQDEIDTYLENSSMLSCMDGHDVGCVSSWAQESWSYGLEYAYANLNGTEIVDGTELTEEYLEDRLSIVKKQLGMAGVRLANALEMALNAAEGEEKGAPSLTGTVFSLPTDQGMLVV